MLLCNPYVCMREIVIVKLSYQKMRLLSSTVFLQPIAIDMFGRERFRIFPTGNPISDECLISLKQ